MNKTKVVVVGIGGRGSWAARKLASDEERYELVALCEKNLGKLDYFKQDSGLERIAGYASIAECIENVAFDAVVVTTPDGTHADVAIPALRAGKYVFVEKPLEITAERCRQIIEADRQAGGKTFVGFNLRFAPAYVKIKELVSQGVIGHVLTIQADEFYDGGRTYFRRWNRLRVHGGGLWITKASHDFDLLYWLAGRKPLAVCASAELSYYVPRADATLYCADCAYRDTCADSFYVYRKADKKSLAEVAAEYGDPRPDLCLYNADKDTFDHGIATVEFEGGLLATYTCNVVAGLTERRIRVAGTKGLIDGTLGGDELVVTLRDPTHLERIPLKTDGGHGGADDVLFHDFYAFTQGTMEPKVRPAEAAVAVLIGLAARHSADTRSRIELSALPA
ncbi:MAG: Gfo/Idh/MocA family oxidoreductase [Anaerolineae bacterium]|nr:Gfo/Idh/MocA family oxidoreductase [Anaerolineae bacterium]